jgi:hypothetical protein
MPDETITREPLDAFVARVGVTMELEPASSNPNSMEAPEPGACHWVCTVKRGNESMTVPFSTGSGWRRWRTNAATRARMHEAPYAWTQLITPGATVATNSITNRVAFWAAMEQYTEATAPTVHDVLECLRCDAASYDGARNFSDWASMCGGDPDSRKWERCYRIIAEQAKALRFLLGDEEYRHLTEEVESE